MLVNTCHHCGKDMGADSSCPYCRHKREISEDEPSKKSSLILTLLLIFLFIVVGIAYITIPNFLRARASGQFTACGSNLKNIGTALEMYANNHMGQYPKHLSDLTPAYIQNIPTCQAANRDTYSAGYISSSVVNAYTYCCKGNHHWQITDTNYPQYNSNQGLVTRP